MKKFLFSILGLAMAVATNAQTATTTTTKTLPTADTIDIGGILAEDVDIIMGDFSTARLEQDIIITHPNANNVLPAMFNAGRYNIETRGNKLAHTPRVNMPVTSGGIDVEQIIRVRLYVSRETIIIR